jgi:hypothetical protein
VRDYAAVAPTFWTGETGKKLRELGPSVQVVALYLLTSPHANLAGLYYLPMAYVSHETGLEAEAVEHALEALIGVGFCRYDHEAEKVWVCEMLRYQVGDEMPPPVPGKKDDSRRVKIKRTVVQHTKSPLYTLFMKRYSLLFHLQDLPIPLRGVDGASTGGVTGRPTPRLPVQSSPVQCLEEGGGLGEGPGTTTRGRLLGGYQRRYETAREMEWQSAPRYATHFDAATRWCDAQAKREGRDPAEVVERLLDGLFADPWAIGNDYPPKLLESQPGKLYAPPKKSQGEEAEQAERDAAVAERLKRQAQRESGTLEELRTKYGKRGAA